MWHPDVVLALAWTRREAFRSLPTRFPTVTFVEEDTLVTSGRHERSTPWGRGLVWLRTDWKNGQSGAPHASS